MKKGNKKRMTTLEQSKLTKGEVRRARYNQNKLAPIRDHAERVVTQTYGKSLPTIRKKKNLCPICKKECWVTDIIHLQDMADFSDDALLGEMNHPYNQLLGCGHDHSYFDWGTKQSIENFNSRPTPMKVDWYEYRIKVFKSGIVHKENLKYDESKHPFELLMDFDEEIKKAKKNIKDLLESDYINWTDAALKQEAEDPKWWSYTQSCPKRKTIMVHRPRPISYYTAKTLAPDGTKKLYPKKYDSIRPVARNEYRYNNIPYRCIKCGVTHSLEIVHIKPIKDYPNTATMLEINNTSVTAPLCKGCHRMLDGNKDIKQSDDYKIWMEEFKVVHNEFKSKYKFK